METVKKKIEKVKVELAPQDEYQEKSQVLIKASMSYYSYVRIWPTTFLVCNQSGKRSKLLFTRNISNYPEWEVKFPSDEFYLIFEGLPKGCTSFDLLEEIPEEGAFHVQGISRTQSDVYRVIID